MKPARGFAVLLLAVLAAGCSPMRTAKIYEGPAKPDAEIAIVRAVKNGPLEAEFLRIGRGSDGWLLRRFDRSTAHPLELKVDPGSYQIVLRCDYGFMFAQPFTTLTVAPGKTYSMGCAEAGPERARASLLKVEPHAPG